MNEKLNEIGTYVDGIESYVRNSTTTPVIAIMECITKIREILQEIEDEEEFN